MFLQTGPIDQIDSTDQANAFSCARAVARFSASADGLFVWKAFEIRIERNGRLL